MFPGKTQIAQQLQRVTENRRGQIYNTFNIWNGLLKKKKILGNENIVGFLIEYICFLGMLQIIANVVASKTRNSFISYSSTG